MPSWASLRSALTGFLLWSFTRYNITLRCAYLHQQPDLIAPSCLVRGPEFNFVCCHVVQERRLKRLGLLDDDGRTTYDSFFSDGIA